MFNSLQGFDQIREHERQNISPFSLAFFFDIDRDLNPVFTKPYPYFLCTKFSGHWSEYEWVTGSAPGLHQLEHQKLLLLCISRVSSGSLPCAGWKAEAQRTKSLDSFMRG